MRLSRSLVGVLGALLALLLAVVACGGGGGASPTATRAPVAPSTTAPTSQPSASGNARPTAPPAAVVTSTPTVKVPQGQITVGLISLGDTVDPTRISEQARTNYSSSGS